MKMLRHQMQNQRGPSQIGLCISHLSLFRLCGVHSHHSEYIWNECFDARLAFVLFFIFFRRIIAVKEDLFL